MQIKIMGYERAIRYKPKVITLAMRIFDPDGCLNSPTVRLNDSVMYRICGYTFSDIDPDEFLRNYPDRVLPNNLFNEGIALQILDDFRRLRDGCSELLVHCTLGAVRSPAVAIALNDIFELGNDSEEMRNKHKKYNRYIYSVLMNVASR